MKDTTSNKNFGINKTDEIVDKLNSPKSCQRITLHRNSITSTHPRGLYPFNIISNIIFE